MGSELDRLKKRLGRGRRERAAALAGQVRELDDLYPKLSQTKRRTTKKRIRELLAEIADLDPELEVPTANLVRLERKGKATKGKKKGRREEERVAAHLEADTQPNSGAGIRKGDYRLQDVARGDTKETSKRSFVLTLEDLMKLEAEAAGEEVPLFTILFKRTPDGLPRRYAVIPWRDLT